MPLTLLGLSWKEATTSPPGIVRFKVPSLVGWKPVSSVVDIHLDNTPAGATGELQFLLQGVATLERNPALLEQSPVTGEQLGLTSRIGLLVEASLGVA